MAVATPPSTEAAWNWHHPDYRNEYARRSRMLTQMRKAGTVDAIKAFYRTHPVEFIDDWCFTFDPRNADVGLPTSVPFVLFRRQAEYLEWLYARWKRREDGLVEKSRDMGISWLCCAFAVWMFLFHAGTVVGFGSRKEEYVDKIGDPKSLFWKLRFLLDWMPPEFLPTGWDAKKHTPFMRVVNPEIGSSIVGEAGDNIGRGNRATVYFKDESAFYEHPDLIDAALSQTSNCKIDVSTPNGSGNPFHKKRHGGRIPVFVFDWRDDPRKGADWYARQKATLEPHILAQEVDRDYEASVTDAWIPGPLVATAAERGPAGVPTGGGLRVGVDVARFGDDKTVVTFRRGRALLAQHVMAKLDVVQVAARVKVLVAAYNEKPEQIAVDTIGIGAGVADMLRGWYPDEVISNRRTGAVDVRKVVVDVNSSLRMDTGEDYNLRAFMWRQMKEWLDGAGIPNDQELRAELTALRYSYRGGELLIESKDDAKKRGIKSPDRADSLALTFAIPTIPKTKDPTMFVPAPVFDSGMGALG